MMLGQYCKRNIMSHGYRTLHAFLGHIEDVVVDFLIAVSEHAIQPVSVGL